MERSRILRTVKREAALTLKRPWRVVNMARASKWTAKYRHVRYSRDVPFDTASDESFTRRVYPSYGDYVSHQAAKRDAVADLTLVDSMEKALPPRIASVSLKPGSSVLCLGARSGAECKAFISAGHFAIGIDLNPGESSKLVLEGDFHSLQFAENSIDAVFTNSLDHAFDLARVAGEVRRVLKPGGTFWVEASLGRDDSVEARGMLPTDYEAIEWTSVNDLFREIEKAGFKLARTENFEDPWAGTLALMVKR